MQNFVRFLRPVCFLLLIGGSHSAPAQSEYERTLSQGLSDYRMVIALLAYAESQPDDSASVYVSAARALYIRKEQAFHNYAERYVASVERGEPEEEMILALVDALGSRTLHPIDRLSFADLLEAIDAPDLRSRGAAPSALQQLRDLDTTITAVRSTFDQEIVLSGQRGIRERVQWDAYVRSLQVQHGVDEILATLRSEELWDPDAAEPSTRGSDGRVFGTELPEKHLVLTFDDGPHGKYTKAILEILDNFRAPAYFFAVGERLGNISGSANPQLYPRAELYRTAYEQNHMLGNHSYSHANLPKLSELARGEEIRRTNLLLRAITGNDNEFFRPPYGASNSALLEQARAQGLKTIMWNIDSWDWGDPVPRSIMQRVVERVEKAGHGILLFHDIHRQTVIALPMILQELTKRGYKFVNLDGEPLTPAPIITDSGARNDDREAPADLATKSPSGYYRTSWAVVIGVNDYDHWPKLQYAVNDASAIEEILVERFKFPKSQVFTLTDSEATRDNIVNILGGTLADSNRVGPDDRVFVFFAGHGATRKLPSGRELGYLIPVDAELGRYYTRGISMTHLRDFSDLIPAKHVYFIMDACYSGIALSRGGGANAGSDTYFEEVTRRVARQILTAGGADETVADDGPGGHSIFTWTLLQGLQGLADLDGNGLLTATELGAFAAPLVSKFSEQTPAFGNLVGSAGGEFVFEVDYESLSEVSRQLDDTAAELNAKLAYLQNSTMKKLERNLSLRRQIASRRHGAFESPDEHIERKAMANRHHALGLQYFREKRYKLASVELEQAVSLNPNNPTIVNNYGFLLYKMDRYEESIEWFERTVNLDEGRIVVYLNLADAYLKLGDAERAAVNYRKYLQLWPESPRAQEIENLLPTLDSQSELARTDRHISVSGGSSVSQ